MNATNLLVFADRMTHALQATACDINAALCALFAHASYTSCVSSGIGGLSAAPVETPS